MNIQKMDEGKTSTAPAGIYCPHCAAIITDDEIIPAVFVSRGREYRWYTCNRCGGTVASPDAPSAPDTKDDVSGKTSAA